MLSREVRVAAAPEGLPRSSDLEIVSVEVPEPGPGEVLVRNRYFSVFAALRTLLAGVQGAPLSALRVGDTLFGPAIGEVLSAPGGSGLHAGDLVQHMLGWREYAAVPVAGASRVVLPDPIAHFAQGTVAYGALTRGVRVERGDTVFVSGGAGSVGSMAGQIARLLGAGRVIGSTGSAWKAERMIAELGYDAVVARGATPDEGIDVLVDCVGGADLGAAISAANKGARFALVGALSGQLDPRRDGLTAPAEIDTFAVILKQITMVGYSPLGDTELRTEWDERFAGWLKDGVIAYPHVRVEGIDQAPRTLEDMLAGRHLGAVVVAME